MTSKVCVLGSINMDVVVRVERFPQAGKILIGFSCDLMPGGVQNERVIRQTAEKVLLVVDTTGAGDCFCGSLVAFLYNGYLLDESLALAQKAAAYSIQHKGASPSFPKLETLNLNTTNGETT